MSFFGRTDDLEAEGDPAVVAQVVEDDLTKYARDAKVAADAVDGHVDVRVVLVMGVCTVDVDVDARPLRAHVAATERETVLRRVRRPSTDEN